MPFGLALAQVGPFADPTSVTTMAEDAERRGYDERWVLDRLLHPVAPMASEHCDVLRRDDISRPSDLVRTSAAARRRCVPRREWLSGGAATRRPS